ncbi:MAG: endonuclease/exonuclease/phosphatase family protein, partial [Patescibacteria group bacterium]|nr:endonuclease/exonuclease/phosphatase family protein [Patescibacteria group bacterium]
MTLASYNIQIGLQPEAIESNILFLAKNGTDVICLQEVRKDGQTKFSLSKLLHKLGPGWQEEHFLSDVNNFDFGLAMLWKTPTVVASEFKKIRLPKLEKLNFIEASVHRFGGFPALPNQRGALIGNFKIGGDEIEIVNVHLDWQGGLRQREKQVRFLANHIGTGERIVICGDLNTVGFFPG